VLSEGEDKAFSEIKKKVESWLDYSIAQKTVDNEKKVKIYRLGELAIKDENNNRDEEDGNKK
jgi:hypothetical protein